MNDILEASVNSRKNALLQACTNQNMIEEINEYFTRVEEFAKNCSDVMDFENKFNSSELGKEYTDLFVKATSTGTEENVGSELAKDIAADVVDDITHGARVRANQEAYDKVRDIPVVGEALNVKQHFDFFSKFRRKKDD